MSRTRPKAGVQAACLAGACLLLLAACNAVSRTGVLSSAGKPARPHQAFAHEEHDPALEEKGMDCELCHVLEAGDVTGELSEAGLRSCHTCHVEGPDRMHTGLRCVSCHRAGMLAILPADHRAGWVENHGTQIQVSRLACSQCHSNRFCVRCHTRRDEAERNFHKGPILSTHAMQARADPAQCQKCHKISYCTRCHRSGRF